MNINFIEVLTKPLRFKDVPKFALNFFLLFLPTVLIAIFLGVENWIFKTLLSIGLIVLNGYFWLIFQHEVEGEDNKLPEWKFIDTFFIGLKGLIFSLVYTVLFTLVLFILYMIIYYFPNLNITMLIIAGLWTIIWIFMVYAIAMGIFSEKFNPLETFNFSTMFEIVNECWTNYLFAIFYMLGYLFILGMICWACVIFFGNNNNFIIGFFSIYAITVYLLLYAQVFKNVRSEYESHI